MPGPRDEELRGRGPRGPIALGFGIPLDMDRMPFWDDILGSGGAVGEPEATGEISNRGFWRLTMLR